MIELRNTTGNALTDDVMRGTIGLCELCFPNRVRGYYIVGSYGDRTAVSSSDLDLDVVFKGSMVDGERQRLAWLEDHLRLVSPIDIDFGLVGEQYLFEHGDAIVKIAGRCVYGEDILEQIPLLPLDQYVRQCMHRPYRFFASMRNNPDVLPFPMQFPDPDDEWGGYARRMVRLADGTEHPTTKNMVVSAGWAATAIIALRAGQYVANKSDCLRLYRAHINDEWMPLLDALYTVCRGRWSYFLPTDPVDRSYLRTLCEQTLAFENHFLAIYRDFLLGELHVDNVDLQLMAAQRLSKIKYGDKQVVAALIALDNHQHPPLRDAAHAALRVMGEA